MNDENNSLVHYSEAGKIVAFLQTLNGKQPSIVYPILPPNSETTPRPLLR